MTGYRELGDAPISSAEHFTPAEFYRYRYLAELQTDGNIATELLVGAFNRSDASTMEPLRERFEAARWRIDRNLSALEGSALHAEVAPVYDRLFELGLGADSGFDLLAQQLRLAQHQLELRDGNREIAVRLVGEVDSLVAASEASAVDAKCVGAGVVDRTHAVAGHHRGQHRGCAADCVVVRGAGVAASFADTVRLDAPHGRRRSGSTG